MSATTTETAVTTEVKAETPVMNAEEQAAVSARATEVRARVGSLINAIDESFYEMGELLDEVNKSQYWKLYGYESFDLYSESEVGVKKRRAYYLIEIWQTFHQIPRERMTGIGWSKMKELCQVFHDDMSAEDQDKWFQLAREIPVPALVEKVKEAKKALKDKASGTTTPGTETKPTETAKSMSFKLFPDQHTNVELALKLAKDISGSEKTGNLLDLICTDFISARADKAKDASISLEVMVQNIERNYGVKLIPAPADAAPAASEGSKE